jgi:hypothetical protein
MYSVSHRKIRLIEGNAKCCSLKNGPAAGVYLSENPHLPSCIFGWGGIEIL